MSFIPSIDVKGRVVLALRYEPGETDPSSPFDGKKASRYSDLRYKAMKAREAGAAALIDEIDKVRPPYNVSVLNAEATLFALEHAGEYARQAALLREQRERLQAALRALPGVTAYPSEANMILLRVADAKRTFEGMKARGVLVKNVSALHPLLANCLRLTVGTPDENALMIDALKASL